MTVMTLEPVTMLEVAPRPEIFTLSRMEIEQILSRWRQPYPRCQLIPACWKEPQKALVMSPSQSTRTVWTQLDILIGNLGQRISFRILISICSYCLQKRRRSHVYNGGV